MTDTSPSVEPVETTSPSSSVEPVETTSPPSSVEPVETTSPETPTPLLRVVKGDPTPEELAALVSVVAGLAAGAAAAAPQERPRRPEWNAHHRAVRPAHRHGAGAWRASAW